MAHMNNINPSERNILLDNLRGLAILGVIAVHSIYAVNTFIPHGENDFFTYMVGLGKYGVELFFFISGALMYSIYGLSGSFESKKYWIRRVARIYPLWIFFLIVWMILGFLFQYGGVSEILVGSANMNNFSHTFLGMFVAGSTFTLFLSAPLWNTVIPGGWSIQAEMFHYVCFALIRRIKFNRLLTVIAFLNAFTLISQSVRIPGTNTHSWLSILLDAWIRSGFYSSLSFFTLGILFGIIISSNTQSSVRNKLDEILEEKQSKLIPFILSFILIPTPFGYTVEALGYVLIMILVGFLSLSSNTGSWFLRFIGKYSYFMYFAHFLILDFLKGATKNLGLNTEFQQSQKVYFLVFYALTLLLSTAVAIPSMRYFEGPVMKLARRKS